MGIRRAFLVCYCLLALPVGAADTSADLAGKFVQLLRYSDQYREYQRACVTSTSTIKPESYLVDNPKKFGGIRPGTKYWPDVLAAYETYYKGMCSRPTEKEFMSALAEAYSQNLSQSDLEKAIAFYSSPTGKRLVAAHKIAASNVYAEWGRLNAQHAPTANAQFERRIEELSRQAARR
jgi:hypothetical protein